MIDCTLHLPDGTKAHLDNGLRWHSADERLQDRLNLHYSPLTDPNGVSPADGAPGAAQVNLAARRMHAKVIWHSPAPETADKNQRVY